MCGYQIIKCNKRRWSMDLNRLIIRSFGCFRGCPPSELNHVAEIRGKKSKKALQMITKYDEVGGSWSPQFSLIWNSMIRATTTAMWKLVMPLNSGMNQWGERLCEDRTAFIHSNVLNCRANYTFTLCKKSKDIQHGLISTIVLMLIVKLIFRPRPEWWSS